MLNNATHYSSCTAHAMYLASVDPRLPFWSLAASNQNRKWEWGYMHEVAASIFQSPQWNCIGQNKSCRVGEFAYRLFFMYCSSLIMLYSKEVNLPWWNWLSCDFYSNHIVSKWIIHGDHVVIMWPPSGPMSSRFTVVLHLRVESKLMRQPTWEVLTSTE